MNLEWFVWYLKILVRQTAVVMRLSSKKESLLTVYTRGIQCANASGSTLQQGVGDRERQSSTNSPSLGLLFLSFLPASGIRFGLSHLQWGLLLCYFPYQHCGWKKTGHVQTSTLPGDVNVVFYSHRIYRIAMATVKVIRLSTDVLIHMGPDLNNAAVWKTDTRTDFFVCRFVRENFFLNCFKKGKKKKCVSYF